MQTPFCNIELVGHVPCVVDVVVGTQKLACNVNPSGQVPVVKGEDEDVVGTQTPFCSVALVPQKPFVVVEDVVGTQTPFCSTALVPQKPFVVVVDDVVGTQTPFCSTALVPHILDELDVPKF